MVRRWGQLIGGGGWGIKWERAVVRFTCKVKSTPTHVKRCRQPRGNEMGTGSDAVTPTPVMSVP